MRVYVPFRAVDMGGPSVFVRKLAQGLGRLGVEVDFQRARGADVALLVIGADPRVLLDLKARRIPTAVRLDGTATPATTPRWRRYNLRAFVAYHLADAVVFQSRYSRFMVERFLGPLRGRPHVTIYNGVDLGRFQPEGPRSDALSRGDLFAAAVFRHEHQLRPLTLAMDRIRAARPDATLVVAGRVTDPLLPLLEAPGVRFVGPVRNDDLPAWERAAGAFLFAGLNPPCPNAVIEALACGCPVVGYRTGAMEELVGEDGPLAPHPDDGLTRFVSGDPDALAELALRTLDRGDEARDAARARAERLFSLDEMCRRYADFLAEVAGRGPSIVPGLAGLLRIHRDTGGRTSRR